MQSVMQTTKISMEQNGQLIPLFKDYQEIDLFPATQEEYFISKMVVCKTLHVSSDEFYWISRNGVPQ